MLNLKNLSFFALLASLTVFSSCDHDDHDHDHEEEVITTLNIQLMSSTDTLNINYRDIDGDGGMDPVYTVDTLMANTAYSYKITVLNESETPAENVHDEIMAEGAEHQFFFLADNALNLTVATTDVDATNNPLGLEGTFTTTAASTGNLRVILRHEPKKPNTGEQDAGGESDIDINFALTIQ